MKILERKINRRTLVKEIVFDFEDKNTRITDDSIFLKVKETPMPLEIGNVVTFTKTLQYSSDASQNTIEKEFTILNIVDDVIEIESTPINQLYCNEVTEYSKFDEEMDDNETKLFNYLPQDYSIEKNYFILNFDNPHFISENENFSLNLTRTSPYAENKQVFCYTEGDLPIPGVINTLYNIKYDGDGIEEKNIVKHWAIPEGEENEDYIPLPYDKVEELLKDRVTEGEVVAEFYKHFGQTIDENKLQLVLEAQDYEWFYFLKYSKIHVTYNIDDETYDDRIFFKSNGEKIILSNNVVATVVSENLHVNIPLLSNDGLNLHQENLLKSEYIDDVIDNAIPEIIDYEKNIIKPYIKLNDGTFKRASQIIFNLHFRDRTVGGSKIITDNWTIENGSSLWNTNDKGETIINKSDLLWQLGFDKDDVYYQKMKLQKSFLRLSFYDSQDPMNQNLLFYSTVFMDTGELYGKYNKLKTMASEDKIDGYDSESDVMYIDIDGLPRLSSQFVVTDRFNSYKSSEGFYIYLFNKNMPPTIYMKVEFNHAKYGKTIPFLYFKDGKIKEEGYRRPDKNGGQYVNMYEYFNDLYIPLKVQYDEESTSYIYYLPEYDTDTSDIIFNLFEPKIN